MTDIGIETSTGGATTTATKVRTRRRTPFGRWFRTVGWRHLVGVVALVFALFPVVFIVSSSLNPTGSLASSELLPTEARVLEPSRRPAKARAA